MTRRLATMCFMAMFLIGLSSVSVRAQEKDATSTNLKGLSALCVLVEELPPGALKILHLTAETIQSDVELKLRLAGMRVVTQEECHGLPGAPFVYVKVILPKNAGVTSIDIELHEDVRLERNGQFAAGVGTWVTSGLIWSNPTGQDIRDEVRNLVDEFLNAWLSVNPKK